MQLIYDTQTLSFPQSYGTLFLNANPLALDIGAGKGEFVVKMATARPDWNFLSIESRLNRVRSIEKKLLKNNLSNVRILHSKIEHLIPHSFFPQSVDQAFMNFPDPWQKRRQTHNRSFSPLFLAYIEEILKPGSSFYFATDVSSYAQYVYEILKSSKSFVNELGDTPWLEEVDELYHTLFYKHALSIGVQSKFLRFRKNL